MIISTFLLTGRKKTNKNTQNQQNKSHFNNQTLCKYKKKIKIHWLLGFQPRLDFSVSFVSSTCRDTLSVWGSYTAILFADGSYWSHTHFCGMSWQIQVHCGIPQIEDT